MDKALPPLVLVVVAVVVRSLLLRGVRRLVRTAVEALAAVLGGQ